MNENYIDESASHTSYFDPMFEPPEDFLEECRQYWETAKNRDRSGGYYIIERGVFCFVVGNIKIKVSEHFTESGKTIKTLMSDVVGYAAAHEN